MSCYAIAGNSSGVSPTSNMFFSKTGNEQKLMKYLFVLN